jgi:hypothetical protein
VTLGGSGISLNQGATPASGNLSLAANGSTLTAAGIDVGQSSIAIGSNSANGTGAPLIVSVASLAAAARAFQLGTGQIIGSLPFNPQRNEPVWIVNGAAPRLVPPRSSHLVSE